ncbi:MAG: FtsW/RodA/SpoVE family cell cycle protein [Armatimonadota bacterium]
MKKLSIRQLELRFLIYAFIILYTGLILTSLAVRQKIDINAMAVSLFYFLVALLASSALSALKKNYESYLFPLAIFISNIGLIELYRISDLLFYKQINWLIIGILIYFFIVLLLKNYRSLANYSYLFLIIGIILQVMVSVWGTEINYAKLWFDLGFFYFQPSEIIKILLVIFLAYYLSEYKEYLSARYSLTRISTFKYMIPVFVMWLLCMFIIVLQKDMGMALLLFSIFITMFYLSTSRKDIMVTSIMLFAGGSYLCYRAFAHIKVRFISWLNPWSDPYGMGHQIIQGLFSITAGGLFGTGLGMGKPYYVPAVQTDFIFSAISEEMGFLGATALIILYLLFIGKAFKVSINVKESFGKLLSAGLTAIIAWQSIVIIAGNLKIIPLTGITLPFVSYGGSSIVSNFIILGLLTVIARNTHEEKEKAK